MTESVTDKVVDTITDNELTETMLSAGNWVADNQELLLQYAVNLISAVLILFIGNIIVKSIANGVAKVLRKKDMDEAVVEFLHSLVRYLLFVIVLIAALGRLGVQTASVVAVIGAAGLAIGLALQGSLSNFAAGVSICSNEEMIAAIGCEPGAVCPFGLPENITLIIDPVLYGFDEIMYTPGKPTSTFSFAGADLDSLLALLPNPQIQLPVQQ